MGKRLKPRIPGIRKRRQRPEQALQIAVAKYLGYALRPPTYWTSIDHGVGKLSPAEAGLRKLRGVQAGIADLLVIHPMGVDFQLGALVVWIELKTGKLEQSVAQVAFEKAVWAAGCQYYVCGTIEDVECILLGLGIPLHATTWGKGTRRAA